MILLELNAIGNALILLEECETQIKLTFMFVLIYILFTNKFVYLDKKLNINTHFTWPPKTFSNI